MSESEIDSDKRRVLEYLKEAPKFMPYLHEERSAGSVVRLLGSRDRAMRALVALVQDQKIEYLENCSPDHFRAFAEVAPPPSAVSEQAAGEAIEERVRATIAPRTEPDLYYPAPWYIGEKLGNGHVVVICAEAHYTCEAASMPAAEAIVLAVNTLVGVTR